MGWAMVGEPRSAVNRESAGAAADDEAPPVAGWGPLRVARGAPAGDAPYRAGSAHLMSMRRGLEASTFGTWITSTPSWKLASTLSVCTVGPSVKERVKAP